MIGIIVQNIYCFQQLFLLKQMYNYYSCPSSPALPHWLTLIWRPELQILSYVSIRIFLFLPQLEKKEQLSSRDFKRLSRVSASTTISRYTTLISGMFMLLMLIGSVLGLQPQVSSDLFLNRLNMSFGIKS